MIDILVKDGILRKREINFDKMKSLLPSADVNSNVVKLTLDEEKSIIIFRKIYEPIRQFGEAKWFLNCYKENKKGVVLDILKEANVNEKNKLNKELSKIRSEVQYA